MEKDNIIIVTNDENEKKECYLLASLGINDKQYIIYKDVDNKDIDNNLMASRIEMLSEEMHLFPLSDDEWKLISDEYSKIIKKQ